MVGHLIGLTGDRRHLRPRQPCDAARQGSSVRSARARARGWRIFVLKDTGGERGNQLLWGSIVHGSHQARGKSEDAEQGLFDLGANIGRPPLMLVSISVDCTSPWSLAFCAGTRFSPAKNACSGQESASSCVPHDAGPEDHLANRRLAFFPR